MDMSVIAPIRNEQDYQNAERTIRALWGGAPSMAEADRLDVLMVLLEAREPEHHRMEPPDPIDAIQVRIQEPGIDRGEFARILSTTSGRVSEILNRRRLRSIERDGRQIVDAPGGIVFPILASLSAFAKKCAGSGTLCHPRHLTTSRSSMPPRRSI